MSDPVYELSVPKKWPVVALSRLREARSNGEIDWVKGPRGKPYYRPEDIDSFIRDYLTHHGRACNRGPKVLPFARPINADANEAAGEQAAAELMRKKRRNAR